MLRANDGAARLQLAMCAGFLSGNGDAHQPLNEPKKVVLFLEVGDQTPKDAVNYPADDLPAANADGR